MKRSRPLSLFLSVLILISCFTISVSASDSENLVDSDLRNWTDGTQVDSDFSDAGAGEVLVQYDKTTGIYTLRHTILDPTYVGTWLGALIDDTELIVGNEYTLSFYLPKYSELSEHYRSFISEGLFEVPYKRGTFTVGLGYIQNGHVVMDDNNYVSIYQENYSSFLGSKVSITFTLEDYVGTPCVLIHSWGSNSISTYYYNFISDVSLVNNTQSKEDGFFDRLFQFFHDLKWEIVGGSCGDSDCNKSPHTSLAYKISVKFQEGLDNLKQFFHDLKWEIVGGPCGDSDCNKSPHTSLADKVVNGLSDFFRGFGNLILYFNWEGEYTNPFEREDSPIDKVSEFFDDLIEYVDGIGTSIENILDSITGGLHIFDEFTSRFPWLKGIAMFCLAIIVLSRFIGL